MSSENGCEKICVGCGCCPPLSAVWIFLAINGVPVAPPPGGAGHYWTVPPFGDGDEIDVILIGFGITSGLSIELSSGAPLPFPYPAPDFSAAISDLTVSPDVGATPGSIAFRLTIVGTPTEGGYGITIVNACGDRTVVGDISAPAAPPCPVITGILPSTVLIGAAEAVTVSGTGLDAPGTWTATATGPAGPVAVPVAVGVVTAASASLTLDTSAAVGGPGTLIFTPDDPGCPPASIPFTVSGF